MKILAEAAGLLIFITITRNLILHFFVLHFVFPDGIWSMPLTAGAASKIAGPIKNAIQGVKGAAYNVKVNVKQSLKPTADQLLKHSQRWDKRIDGYTNLDEKHFEIGNKHLAKAQQYIPKEGVKQTFGQQVKNRVKFETNWMKSQVSYSKAMGAYASVSAAEKLKKTTYKYPGIRRLK